MNYLHYQITAGSENKIIVKMNERANVRLLDPLNFFKYKAGKKFEGTDGGEEMDSPVYLKAPYRARWHVVIDLGRRAGEVRATVDVTRV